MLEAFGSARDALAAGPAAWREHGLGEAQAALLRRPDAAVIARGLDWLGGAGHHLVACHAPDYPATLARSPYPPLALFVAGEPAALWHPMVAVVGSRAATPAGRENAAAFSRGFVAAGLAVGSGLAAGIDTAAHQAALDSGGLTVAVLGTGADVAYPASNRALHAAIEARGALVSEHLPGTAPHKLHFPSRNRILAGLALGTVVIEAAERSGALITARLAAEAGREVFAVPGSIRNPLARGCHRLIRDGAQLVESHREVTTAVGAAALDLAADLRGRLGDPIQQTGCLPGANATDGAGADPQRDRVWSALGTDPTTMDELVDRTGLTTADLSPILLAMELDGRMSVQHGRYYRMA